MDDNTRTQIILAAVSAAGERYEDEAPAAYEARVLSEARRIKVMTSPQSRVAKGIDVLDTCKVFTAEVVELTREASSTRGIVTLKTKPSQKNPEGKEFARTERTDNPEGVAMVKALKPLIGHRVLLWIELEEAGDRKVRIVRHVEDLGLARDADAA